MSKETTPTLPPPPRSDASLLTAQDLFLFNEGTHYRIYDKLGAHPTTVAGKPGTYFGVWAPNASAVSLVGDFNGWNTQSHPLQARGSSGIWFQRRMAHRAPASLLFITVFTAARLAAFPPRLRKR